MVTDVVALTLWVFTVNFALVAPAAMVTLLGMDPNRVSLVSVTTTPPAGAGALSVTVPVAESPPRTLVGLSVSAESVEPTEPAGVTVSVADCVAPPNEPEMVTFVVAATVLVFTAKAALVAPAATVTLAGALATLPLLLVSVTTAPPDGAAPLSVTIPVEELLPLTLSGFSVRPEIETVTVPEGLMVNVAVLVTPAPVAEIVTVVGAETGVVKTPNPAVSDPCGTCAVVGTLATDGLLLDRKISVSLVAGAATLMVPLDPVVLVVTVGLSVSDVGASCGVSVTCACSALPFRLALIVTSVFAVTALVGRLIEADGLPAATVAVAGGLAAGESLVRLTASPPGGACPLNITIMVGCPPPVMVPGEMVNDCSDGGCTPKLTEAEVALSEPVSVTVAGVVTCPT